MMDLIVAPRCLLCRCELRRLQQPRLCRECRRSIQTIPDAACTRCRLPFTASEEPAHRCHHCLEVGHFRQLYCVGLYEGTLSDLIKLLKFSQRLDVAPTLGQLLSDHRDVQTSLSHYDCVIPVPLHRKALAERGFNQALLIAQRFARAHRLRLDRFGLRRYLPTLSQVGRTRQQRLENVKKAFRATRSYHGEVCLLIDDVFTTGATAEDCARTLRDAGAMAVDVLTVARTV